MESGTTKIMGIVNLNADSFYEPSRAATQAAFRRRVDALLAQGADILDLGAVSSRPGATDVEVDEEWSRLEPALETLRRHYPGVPVSIDTFRSSIVVMAYQAFGRFWVNDISRANGTRRCSRSSAGSASVTWPCTIRGPSRRCTTTITTTTW